MLLVTDLEGLAQAALDDFDRELSIESGSDLEKQTQRLEAKLEQLYAVAAKMAQREEGLEGVAAVWSQMVSICDNMAKAVTDAHPGQPPRLKTYDSILAIRNACEENRALHA